MSPFAVSRRFKLPPAPELLQAAGCLAIGIYVLFATIRQFPTIPGLQLDGDQRHLVDSLGQAATFWDTMRWWNHTWVGAFHYWRPLTSQFFWMEFHVFTLHRPELWNCVSIVSQLIVDVLLIVLIRQISGKWITGFLGAFLFLGDPFSLIPQGILPDSGSTSTVAITNWKDQADMWVTSATLGAMIAALRGRWGWATLCAAAAPCFKENGWVAVPFIVALLGVRGQLRAVPRSVIVANVLAVAALLVLRWITPGNVFDMQPVGHNVHWSTRYLSVISGPFFALLRAGGWGASVLAVIILLALVTPRISAGQRLIGLALGTVAAALVSSFTTHQQFAVSLVGLLDPRSGLIAALDAAWWLVLVFAVLAESAMRSTVIAFAVFRVISGATVALGLAVGIHTVYLSNAYYCALYALALTALLKRISMLRSPNNPTPHAVETSLPTMKQDDNSGK
ncbi:MAG: hypothetical protein P4L33_02190 [Capsulimonadaceae bacterium]|nr:hypothetical protein [Capsulimonadaceae bacterium]